MEEICALIIFLEFLCGGWRWGWKLGYYLGVIVIIWEGSDGGRIRVGWVASRG